MLSIREITSTDIPLITNYWLNSDPEFLIGMGVQLDRMPQEHEWHNMLTEQLNTPLPNKKSYCIIWLLNNQPIGHCNINKIVPEKEAYLHLHIWNTNARMKGAGVALIKLTLPYFFNAYNLQNLYSEPYALNPAPNKTLSKAGFELKEQTITTPGWLNFEQQVNVWQFSREKYLSLQLL